MTEHPPSDRPTLGVVVVAYRSARTLGALLASVPSDADVVVVDNAAEPAVAAICARFGVQYVDPGANLGFAAAVNLGARRATTELLLVVNPDVDLTLDPRQLAPLLDDPAVLVATGALAGETGVVTSGNIHPRVTPRRELARGLVGWRAYASPPEKGDRFVQADGAWLLVNRASWERLGGLDERYELYFEDVALAHRVHALGGRIAVSPEVVGRHVGGVSAAASGGLSHLLLGVSRVRFYHLSGITRLPRALGVTTSLLEFVSRSITLRPEGFRLRARALRLQLREAWNPGSVWLLGPARDMTPR